MEWQTDRRHYHANSRTHWSAKRKQKMKQPLQSDVTAYTKVHLQQIMWTVSRRVGHKTVIVLQCRSLHVVRNICIWGWLSPSICQIFRKSGRPITTLYGFTHQTWRYKSSSNRFPVTKNVQGYNTKQRFVDCSGKITMDLEMRGRSRDLRRPRKLSQIT